MAILTGLVLFAKHEREDEFIAGEVIADCIFRQEARLERFQAPLVP